MGANGRKILATGAFDWAKSAAFYLALDLLSSYGVSEESLFLDVIARLDVVDAAYGCILKSHLPTTTEGWNRQIVRRATMIQLLGNSYSSATFKTRQEVEMERKESLFQSLHDITSPVCRYAHFSLFIHIKTGFLLIEGIWQCNSFEKKGNLGLLTL